MSRALTAPPAAAAATMKINDEIELELRIIYILNFLVFFCGFICTYHTTRELHTLDQTVCIVSSRLER